MKLSFDQKISHFFTDVPVNPISIKSEGFFKTVCLVIHQYEMMSRNRELSTFVVNMTSPFSVTV